MCVPESEVGEREVIKCSLCSKPAVQLDHHYPYYSTYNLCASHRNPTGWGKMSHGAKWHWINKGRVACTYDMTYSGRVLPSKERPPQESICKRCLARLDKRGENNEQAIPAHG